MKIRYFDNAATTRVKDEVLNEMLPYFSEQYGNPSSLYSIGRSAKMKVEEARKKVANLINCNPNEIYFTGCGSESDNTAIKGIAYANKKHGFNVTNLDVDKDGIVNLEQLRNSIRNDTILISIMYANNEIGTIQPIAQISRIAKMYNIIFHTDCVQACGNVQIDVKKMGIDMLSMSGHKLYAPKGIGALYVRNGIEFEKFMDGGHQEKNKRGGTENVPGIIGLGKACELANINLANHMKHLQELRDYYIQQVEEKIPYVYLNGSREKRLPGNANFSFQFIEGESLLLNLDAKGICASSGSACTSGSTEPSHVLTAIGLDRDIAQASLRVTFGEDNTKEDVDYLVENLIEVVNKLRSMSPEYNEFVRNK